MDNLKKEIWQDIIKELSEELVNEGLDIWFYSVKANLNGNTLEIEVPNNFYIEQIKRKEERIRRITEALTGKLPDIKYTLYVYNSPSINTLTTVSLPVNEKRENFQTNLKAEYTFKEMVIGEFNKFAATVSENIAKNSGSLPLLFIYSKPGLGKTHMLHAIGNEMLNNNSSKKILYITAEDFVNEFINSIKQNTIEQFRAKYRNLDCLLIDDIQFIVAKGRSEEEFFFTFNTLFEYKKTIVITSDRKPDDIELNERLISRFKNGILADIKPPEFEARVAILEKENEKNRYGIEKDIIDFLAKNIKDSVRSLKGALMKVYNFSVFTNEFPTIEKVKVWVKEYISETDINDDKKITIEDIQQVVANEYGISVEELMSKQRKEKFVFPRHIAIYLAHELTDMSWTDIGKAFDKDHSTTIHASDKIKNMIINDPFFAEVINKIINKIKAKKEK